MKKITDYNFKLLNVGNKAFLKDMIKESEENEYCNLGEVAIVNYVHEIKLVEVESVNHLLQLYCDFKKGTIFDFLPCTRSSNVHRLLKIFQELSVDCE